MGLFQLSGSPAGHVTTTQNRQVGPQLANQTFGQLGRTLEGDYLYGGPGFDAAYQAASNRIIPQVQSAFSGGGRLNSGLAQQSMTQALGDSFAGLYNNERNRQLQAANIAPQATSTGAENVPYFENDLATLLGLLGAGGSLLGGGGLGGLGSALGAAGNALGLTGEGGLLSGLFGGGSNFGIGGAGLGLGGALDFFGGGTGSGLDLSGAAGGLVNTPTSPLTAGADYFGGGGGGGGGGISSPPGLSSGIDYFAGGEQLFAPTGFDALGAIGGLTGAAPLSLGGLGPGSFGVANALGPGALGFGGAGSSIPGFGALGGTGALDLGAAAGGVTNTAAGGLGGLGGSLAAAAPLLMAGVPLAGILGELFGDDTSAVREQGNEMLATANQMYAAAPKDAEGYATLNLPGLGQVEVRADPNPGMTTFLTRDGKIVTADGRQMTFVENNPGLPSQTIAGIGGIGGVSSLSDAQRDQITPGQISRLMRGGGGR